MEILCPKCHCLLLEDKEERYINGNISLISYLKCTNMKCKKEFLPEVTLYPRLKNIEIKFSFKL
jgi:hypothetical protein